MLSKAFTNAQNWDILHQHTIWNFNSIFSLIWKKKFSKPLVVAPHGYLGPALLQRSRWKKKLALTFYDRALLQTTDCFHAGGETEISHIRDFGLKNPIAVIPNAVTQKWIHGEGCKERFLTRFGIDPNSRIMLYMGRFDPVKGLDLLLLALHKLREKLDPWLLVVIGPPAPYQKTVQSMVDQLNLTKYVRFLEAAVGQEKLDAFAGADILVLPSRGEASPLVVLEALAKGVPVLTTHGTAWQELEIHQCGWWVEISPDKIAETLCNIFERSQEELKQMGQRGRVLVMSKYSWSSAAERTKKMYEWLLGRGDRPDFVV
jgi:glycosyltransferase involved in cell wall biosynthesis